MLLGLLDKKYNINKLKKGYVLLRIIESRIDKKGRIYLPRGLREHSFFKRGVLRVLPIIRCSTKQIERGLLLIKPVDEFEAIYFWGNYDENKRYTIHIDATGRLATTESIMKELGLHPFARKYVYFIKSCYGWELWPEHRLKRLARSYRAYKIKITEGNTIDEKLSSGLWQDAYLFEKFLFSKETVKGLFLDPLEKGNQLKKELNIIVLEKINDVKLLFGGTIKDIKKEIDLFIESSGYNFLLPFLDTESRFVPTRTAKLSCWRTKGVIRLAMQRIRDLSTTEISEQIAKQYVIFSYEKAKKLMERNQLLLRPHNIDNSEVYFTFRTKNWNPVELNTKSLQSLRLIKKRIDVYFHEESYLDFGIDFEKN
jgi:DNA-binding transcriptional regulator/RsmH inhibitor MraZ